MHEISRIILLARETPWAILPGKLEEIRALLELRAHGRLPDEEVKARLLAAQKAAPAARQSGAVAVLPLFGVITQRAGMMSEFSGGTSVEKFTQLFRQAVADPQVASVVIEADSPGGTVRGVPELAEEVFRAREKKRVVAAVNGMAASAAYMIIAGAREIHASPSSAAGSIGVYTMHYDFSGMAEKEGVKVSHIAAGRFKTEGNEFEPLSAGARAFLQSQVDAYYDLFVQAVAKGRGATPKEVREGHGEGRMLIASQAKREGLVDRIATLDETLERLGAMRAPDGARAEGNASPWAWVSYPVGEPIQAEEPAAAAPDEPGQEEREGDPSSSTAAAPAGKPLDWYRRRLVLSR